MSKHDEEEDEDKDAYVVPQAMRDSMVKSAAESAALYRICWDSAKKALKIRENDYKLAYNEENEYLCQRVNDLALFMFGHYIDSKLEKREKESST